MILHRRAAERGFFDFGWLQTHHSFSFGDYYDPAWMGFRGLRVINQDTIQPGQGFGTHPHREMEIVTYVTEGALEHRDSMQNGGVIRPGEVQWMSAGSGITHSEFNHLQDAPTRLLQIWLLPREGGGKPDYEQKLFAAESKQNRLCPIVTPDGRDGSLTIRADASMYASLLDAGRTLEVPLGKRYGWLQLISGAVELNGLRLEPGDGAGLSDEPQAEIEALQNSEFLFFDLA